MCFCLPCFDFAELLWAEREACTDIKQLLACAEEVCITVPGFQQSEAALDLRTGTQACKTSCAKVPCKQRVRTLVSMAHSNARSQKGSMSTCNKALHHAHPPIGSPLGTGCSSTLDYCLKWRPLQPMPARHVEMLLSSPINPEAQAGMGVMYLQMP